MDFPFPSEAIACQPLPLRVHLAGMVWNFKSLAWWFVLLVACGQGGDAPVGLPNSSLPPLLEPWPDTSLYPIQQHISSQHGPLEQFGLQTLSDGNLETHWESRLGLNYGEGFYLAFDGLLAASLQLVPAKEKGLAKISGIRVWLNKGFLGTFLPGQSIPLTEPVKEIYLQFLVDEGWNPVSLPLNNLYGDSLARVSRVWSRLYLSRPLGVAELIFLNHEGKPLPVRFKPQYSANMRVTGPGQKIDKYTLHDGLLGSGIRLMPGEGDRRFFYQFKTDQPIQGFRLLATGPKEAQMVFRVFPAHAPERSWEIKTGWNVLAVTADTLGGKHFSFGWQEVPGKPELSLMELDFWSGARWYQFAEDSLESMPQRRKDSLQGFPMGALVDQVLRYEQAWALPPADGSVWEGERDVPPGTPIRQRETMETCFRADGSFWYFREFQRPLEQKSWRFIAFGRWFPNSDLMEQLLLTYAFYAEEGQGEAELKDWGEDSLQLRIFDGWVLTEHPWIKGLPLKY